MNGVIGASVENFSKKDFIILATEIKRNCKCSNEKILSIVVSVWNDLVLGTLQFGLATTVVT